MYLKLAPENQQIKLEGHRLPFPPVLGSHKHVAPDAGEGCWGPAPKWGEGGNGLGRCSTTRKVFLPELGSETSSLALVFAVRSKLSYTAWK